MIIHDSIEFHNTAALAAVEGKPSLRMQRLPDAVRYQLNPVACEGALCPTSCELRFVTEGPGATVTLYSDVHHEYIQVFQGDFFHEEILLLPGETKVIPIPTLETIRALGHRTKFAFSPVVSRLKISGTGRVHFVTAEGSGLRPPRPEEKPSVRWLAYGSSITQGFSAPRMSLTYITHTARLLGIDVLNLGFGGACHIENALADHFAARDDWDLATLELGVNLIENPITLEEFSDRVRYMVDTLAQAHPDKPVVLITVFPLHHDLRDPHDPMRQRTEAFRQALRDVVSERHHRRLLLVEGTDILTQLTGLSADLCHPSEFGHALMGNNLAIRLHNLLPIV